MLLITVVFCVVTVLAVGLLMMLSLLLSLFGSSLWEYVITVVPTVVAELPFTFSFDQLVAGTFIELDTNVGLLIIELPNELEPDPVRTADEIELSTIVFVSLLTVTGTDLAELDETVLIVELDSVLMLLDDSIDDELFTGRTPPRWLFDVVEFIDDELATSLLLDSTDDSLLEVFIDEVLLVDLIIELFLLETSLELFTLLFTELDFTLDELLMLELLITLDDFNDELFKPLLLIKLDDLTLLELLFKLELAVLLCLLLEVVDEVDELSECGMTSVEFMYAGSSVTVT